MKTKGRIFDDLPFHLWPLLLLIGFGSRFLPPFGVPGYRWTVELAFSTFLLLAGLAIVVSQKRFPPFSNRESFLIALPIVLFVTWSFASVIWAHSGRSSLHHSLLWACYLTFFMFARSRLKDADVQGTSLWLLLAVAAIISLACLVEFVGGVKPLSAPFYHRYFVNSEVLATLLPIIIAFLLIRSSYYAAVVSVLAWSAVVATHSRAIFIAGVVGLFVFFTLGYLKQRTLFLWKRTAAAVLVLVGVSLTFQLIFTGGQPTTFSRLAVQDELTVNSTKLRLVFWGMAWEGLRSRPITGIGADNFFGDYRTLREQYSSANPTDENLEITEGTIPERAHNEYLQILAELGIVGAALFGWLLLGIAYLFWLAYRKKASLMTIGALSGMVTFLVASGASSYSFRFPANGICFFFLLAVASRELFAADEGEKAYRLYKLVPVIGVIVSVAMIAFCVVRANSIRHMTNALNAKDESVRTAAIENAIAIDPSEPMFRFYYGQWLEQAGEHDAAIAQMRIAIDKGLADSTSFYRLAAAQIGAGRSDDAKVTFAEALRVYPRSTFLRTAYAAFLKRSGDIAGADTECRHAFAVNEKQARSWQLAHDEGLERLVQTARLDDRYVSPLDLQPESAPLVVANFQRRALPE